jgi:putative ABC transport system permease protein
VALMARSASRPLLRIAWRNVRAHWRHSFGAILSIVVGFIAIGLFEGYLADLDRLQRDWYVQRGMMGHVIIEKRGASGGDGREDPWGHALQPADQSVIDAYLQARAEDVATRVRILQLAGLASTGRAGVMFVAWGLDVPESADLRGDWAWNATAGRSLHRSGPQGVLLGNGLGALLDCTGPAPAGALRRDGKPSGDERPLTCRQPRVQLSSTTESGQLNVIEPTVVGLFDAGLKDVDNKFLHLPLALAQQLADTRAVTMYAVLLTDEDRIDAFAEGLEAAGRRHGLDLAAVPWHDHVIAELYRRTDSIFEIYRNLVVLIVVTIAGMSVLTTMLKAVNERVREIGTLRSLGFRRRHVVTLFTTEAALLAVVSSGLGLLGTWGVAELVNATQISYDGGMAATPIPLTISVVPTACAFAVLFLSGVAMLAALVPARRAARLSIPDALGHV